MEIGMDIMRFAPRQVIAKLCDVDLLVQGSTTLEIFRRFAGAADLPSVRPAAWKQQHQLGLDAGRASACAPSIVGNPIRKALIAQSIQHANQHENCPSPQAEIRLLIRHCISMQITEQHALNMNIAHK